MRAAGLEIWKDASHGHLMAQPCAQYRGGCCEAYNDRPRQCRNFVCVTLARFEKGEVSMREALRLAELLREKRRFLNGLIATHLPEFADRPLREALRETKRLLEIRNEKEAREIQERHGELLVHTIAFRKFRKEYFGQAGGGE